MWLTQAAVRRPVAMAMFFIAVGLMGLMAYFRLPKQLFPDVEIPFVTVVTVYPGASPDDAERLIGEPIEQAVSTISGVDNVSTTSREGVTFVLVEFEVGLDANEAAADVRDKVAGVVDALPDDAESPIVQKYDFSAQPTIIAGATSAQLDARELRTFADRTIKDRITGASGVASVAVGGGEVREIQIRVKQDRLRAIGMSIGDFRAWLAMQNLDLPGGNLKEGERDYAVRVLGEFDSPEEIRRLTFQTRDGAVVRLSDVAEVADAVAEPDTISRLNGEPSVTFVVTKSSSANVIETADAVKERLALLERTLPGGVRFRTSTDESIFTKDSLHDLVMSLIYGVLFATTLVYWVLRNLRATVIIFFAIPTSLLATFMLMDLAGLSMDFMSMLGLALAIGILVDDSIVVLENIYRHLAMGKAPRQAALDGREEIGLAAVAITMTDVVVFVPIAMMGGIVGKFFRPFGATVAFSTLFSLLVSFTITPMLASRWMKGMDVKHGADEGDTGEQAVRNRTRYVRILDFCISRGGRWVTVIGAALLLVVVGGTLSKRLGMNFFTQADQGEFNVYIELPLGKNLDASNAKAREVEGILAKRPEIETTITDVGRSAQASGTNLAQISVKCCERAPKFARLVASLRGKMLWEVPNKEQKGADGEQGTKLLRVASVNELIAQIEKDLSRIPGATIRVRGPSQGSNGGVNALGLELTGSRDTGLIEYANKVADRLRTEPDLAGVDLSYKVGRPEVKAKLDRVRVTERGLSAAQIASAVRTAIEGDTSLKYREGNDEFDIRIELDESQLRRPAAIADLVVAMDQGQPILLREVATVTIGEGPAELTRKDRQDLITVGFDKARPEIAISEVVARVNELLAGELKPPVGIGTKMGGEADIMAESMGYMVQALAVSVILVFALLVMLYESWFYPMVIMAGVPMAITGAYLGMWVAGVQNSIFGMIGIIMLIGLVTKNSILLIDYTNTLRSRGYSRRDALLRAGPTRYRPIMMTTFALVLSLLPVSTGFGKGAEFRQPLGASVSGGVLFSMYLTLLVMPALYTIFDDLQGIYLRVKGKLFRTPPAGSAEPAQTDEAPSEAE